MTASHPQAQSASSSAKRAEATAQAVPARRLSGALTRSRTEHRFPRETEKRSGSFHPHHPREKLKADMNIAKRKCVSRGKCPLESRQFGLEGGLRPVPRGPSRIGAPGTVGKGITFSAAAKMPRSNDSLNLDQLARHNLRMHQRAKLTNRLA